MRVRVVWRLVDWCRLRRVVRRRELPLLESIANGCLVCSSVMFVVDTVRSCPCRRRRGLLAGKLESTIMLKPNLLPASLPARHSTRDNMATSPSEVDPMSDPEERRVLYSTLDSFR